MDGNEEIKEEGEYEDGNIMEMATISTVEPTSFVTTTRSKSRSRSRNRTSRSHSKDQSYKKSSRHRSRSRSNHRRRSRSRSHSPRRRRSRSRSPKRSSHDRSERRSPHRYHDYDQPDEHHHHRRDYERRRHESKDQERDSDRHDKSRRSRDSPRVVSSSYAEEKEVSRKDHYERREKDRKEKVIDEEFPKKASHNIEVESNRRSHENLIKEKNMELIRARYLGMKVERKPRRNLRPGEKKFVFDWDASEDTTLLNTINALAASSPNSKESVDNSSFHRSSTAEWTKRTSDEQQQIHYTE
jgi:ATP-dependent RNA helicase DDX23/PRP28